MRGRLTAEAEAARSGSAARFAPNLADDPARVVAAVLDARLSRGSPAPVALGLSGGGDSLALLHLAAAWARAAGRPLLALTVDHGLDPASAAWMRRAAVMATVLGAPWRGLAWAGPKPATGVPAAARAARHALLAQAAREAGVRVILLAHTADDAAEGDVMRAGDAPGMGGLREWGPSPAWPQGRGVALLRPLLRARRGDLRAWLLARGLDWIEDPANADASHPRIRARHALAARHAPPTAPAEPAAAPLFHADACGAVRASRRALAQAPAAAARTQLAAALACAGGRAGPVRGRVAAAILDDLRCGAPVRRNAGGALVDARGDAVVLSPEPPRRAGSAGTDPAWTGPRLGLAIGRITREAELG